MEAKVKVIDNERRKSVVLKEQRINLITKMNAQQIKNQTYHKGEKTFATKGNLANHTGKHKEPGMKKQCEIGLNRIENTPQDEENVASVDLSIDDNLKENVKLSEHFSVDEGDENSTTESESGESEEISQSLEKLSISSVGNVTDQLSD